MHWVYSLSAPLASGQHSLARTKDVMAWGTWDTQAGRSRATTPRRRRAPLRVQPQSSAICSKITVLPRGKTCRGQARARWLASQRRNRPASEGPLIPGASRPDAPREAGTHQQPSGTRSPPAQRNARFFVVICNRRRSATSGSLWTLPAHGRTVLDPPRDAALRGGQGGDLIHSRIT